MDELTGLKTNLLQRPKSEMMVERASKQVVDVDKFKDYRAQIEEDIFEVTTEGERPKSLRKHTSMLSKIIKQSSTILDHTASV